MGGALGRDAVEDPLEPRSQPAEPGTDGLQRVVALGVTGGVDDGVDGGHQPLALGLVLRCRVRLADPLGGVVLEVPGAALQAGPAPVVAVATQLTARPRPTARAGPRAECPPPEPAPPGTRHPVHRRVDNALQGALPGPPRHLFCAADDQAHRRAHLPRAHRRSIASASLSKGSILQSVVHQAATTYRTAGAPTSFP